MGSKEALGCHSKPGIFVSLPTDGTIIQSSFEFVFIARRLDTSSPSVESHQPPWSHLQPPSLPRTRWTRTVVQEDRGWITRDPVRARRFTLVRHLDRAPARIRDSPHPHTAEVVAVTHHFLDKVVTSSTDRLVTTLPPYPLGLPPQDKEAAIPIIFHRRDLVTIHREDLEVWKNFIWKSFSKMSLTKKFAIIWTLFVL